MSGKQYLEKYILPISDGMHMKILFKNAAFLISRIFASAMIRVFPSLEHSTGHVHTPKTNCRTFVPPIVFGVSDMSPLDCPNVEETRNPMQISGRKKCSHFFTKNIPSAFPSEIARHDLLVLLLIIALHITPKGDCPFHAAAPFLCPVFIASFISRASRRASGSSRGYPMQNKGSREA